MVYLKLINRCIHEIHYGDDEFNRVDISDKDIEEFIDQFTLNSLKNSNKIFSIQCQNYVMLFK